MIQGVLSGKPSSSSKPKSEKKLNGNGGGMNLVASTFESVHEMVLFSLPCPMLVFQKVHVLLKGFLPGQHLFSPSGLSLLPLLPSTGLLHLPLPGVPLSLFSALSCLVWGLLSTGRASRGSLPALGLWQEGYFSSFVLCLFWHGVLQGFSISIRP